MEKCIDALQGTMIELHKEQELKLRMEAWDGAMLSRKKSHSV